MSDTCDIKTCKRASCALCHCCKQNVCRTHLNEHQDLLNSQLNPLIDQINALGNRLKTINLNTMIDDCREKLEKWRMNCHKKIDDFFEQKCQELEEHVTKKVDKQREEIGRVQSELSELIYEEDATRQKIELLTSTVRDLENDVNKLEQMFIHVKNRPLVLDENMIEIEEVDGSQSNILSLAPALKTIPRSSENGVTFASNNRSLIFHHAPNLCLLNQDMTTVQKVTWVYAKIRSSCWSSSLKHFVVITEKEILFVDDNTMLINEIKTLPKRAWQSCTCSDSFLFLSTCGLASAIMEYSLQPSVPSNREWKSPDTCQRKECISDMKYNNQTLALMIARPSDATTRIELRNSQTLTCLWSLRLDMTNNKGRAFHCCLVNNDEWFVMDHEACRLLHITNNGKLKSTYLYEEVPWEADIFGSNILAISTNDGINFHKL